MRKIREKMPKNLKLRRKLMNKLLLDAYTGRYVTLLLGYSTYFFNEAEWNCITPDEQRLLEDAEYRRKEVKVYLKKYGLN